MFRRESKKWLAVTEKVCPCTPRGAKGRYADGNSSRPPIRQEALQGAPLLWTIVARWPSPAQRKRASSRASRKRSTSPRTTFSSCSRPVALDLEKARGTRRRYRTGNPTQQAPLLAPACTLPSRAGLARAPSAAAAVLPTGERRSLRARTPDSVSIDTQGARSPSESEREDARFACETSLCGKAPNMRWTSSSVSKSSSC